MSFRNKPRRSSSSFRSQSSNSTIPGLASYNRPRSLSFLSPSISTYNPYTSPGSKYSNSTPYLNNYNYNAYNPYSKYTSNPYSTTPTNYGGTNTGYGGISLPSTTLNALNIMPSSYSPSSYSPKSEIRDVLKGSTTNNSERRTGRSVNRNGSFNRSRSQSGVRDSGMGSRSVSLSSLNSEGYVSGSEKSNRSSRLGAVSDLAMRGENGELDYKKMYESAVSENDRLRDKLRKSDEELRDTKQTLEKINTVTSKNSLSELEKRERRAMERKLSEMEEELKQLQKLKAENERLRAENRALTRVVSKLTNSSTGKK